MNRWTSVLLVLGVVFFVVGWALVLTSGYGGDGSGGSEITWRIGGLMLYAGVPMLLLAGSSHIAHLIRAAKRRRHTPSPH